MQSVALRCGAYSAGAGAGGRLSGFAKIMVILKTLKTSKLNCFHNKLRFFILEIGDFWG